MHRLDRLPGGVARLVDAVPEADIARCVQRLTAAAADVVGQAPAEAGAALGQWRDHGAVSPATLTALRSALVRHDLDAMRFQRRGETDRQRRSFATARMLDCIASAVDPRGAAPRSMLREVAYEAAAAMGGSGGVVSILEDFVV